MQAHEVVRAIVIGSVLIVLGLIPGLFQRLKQGTRNFSESFWSPSPFSPVGLSYKTDHEKHSRPTWLALLGLAMILLSLFSYFSNL
jgi:hypothetical protein